MVGTVTLQLPVKAYLKKFLVNKFGESYTVSRTNWLGVYIVEVLDKNYHHSKKQLSKEDSFTLIVPYSIVAQYGLSISNNCMYRLELMIKKVFLSELYSYLNVSKANELKVHDKQHNSIIKQNAIRGISQFLSYYGIEEDELSSDSVYRQYYRDKKVTT